MHPTSWLTALCGRCAADPELQPTAGRPPRGRRRFIAGLGAPHRPRLTVIAMRPPSPWTPIRAGHGGTPCAPRCRAAARARRRPGLRRRHRGHRHRGRARPRPLARGTPTPAGRHAARASPGRWCCWTSAARSNPARPRWPGTPSSAPPTRRGPQGRPRPGSACSPSAPRPARATASAVPPTRRSRPAAALQRPLRRSGRGLRRLPRRARRRRGHRRLHRQRAAQGHRGRVRHGRRSRRERGAPRAAALLGVAGTVVVCHGARRPGPRLGHRPRRPPAGIGTQPVRAARCWPGSRTTPPPTAATPGAP